ncbi:MAG: hypothetical protein D8M59_06615 [Planctomycetes bacterium]|nr:hypothetical protein [Planctomycetota bacterium]
MTQNPHFFTYSLQTMMSAPARSSVTVLTMDYSSIVEGTSLLDDFDLQRPSRRGRRPKTPIRTVLMGNICESCPCSVLARRRFQQVSEQLRMAPCA